MPDVSLVQSGTANGAATPATMTLTGVTNGNMLLCVIDVRGTSPTIATPTGDAWVQVQNQPGTQVSQALYVLVNAGAGSHTPSSVLGGTVTGWICCMFEFNQMGTAPVVLGSNGAVYGNVLTVNNQFPVSGQPGSPWLFFYTCLRTGTSPFTTPAPVTGLQNLSPSGGPLGGSLWSPSVQQRSGIQSMSVDHYWGSNLSCPQGIGFPVGAGGFTPLTPNACNIAAWFTSQATSTSPETWVAGAAGVMNVGPGISQGEVMVGG